MEYILDDRTRVDCLTRNYAIEFDFARKWVEAIGQALYYGLKTGRRPGVVLIMEDPIKEGRYLDRLRAVADQHGIKIWIMTRPEESVIDLQFSAEKAAALKK